MIAALRFLIDIDDRLIPLLEIGHGCWPANVGVGEMWSLGLTDWGYASF